MTIQLSSELEEIIRAKVASGMYPNATEFIREAILQTVEREQLKRTRLNEAVAVGVEQADRGEFSDRTIQEIIDHKEAEKYG